MKLDCNARTFVRIGAWVLVVFVVMPAAEAEEPGITRSRFQELHRQLTPDKGKRWRLLPWKTSLVTAVRQASKQERPIYMLVRSGHPLGCV